MRIELGNVSKHYGKIKAIDNVSMTIDPGRIVAVLGANGAGKTTILKILSGVTAPDTGEYLLDGDPFRRDRTDLRRRLCCLPDFPLLFPGHTVLQNIAIYLNLYETSREGTEEWVVEVLTQLDLLSLGDAPIHTLSRGQAYKTALAALLTVYPEVWIFDEPFASGMDPQGIEYFKEQARTAAAQGCTIIYTTQILDIAERFSDWVGILDEGELKHWGTASEMKALAGVEQDALARLMMRLRSDS
ncbi:ATP-binding cassette domain-containing protein [bacterium]|nr:ATP-binding cassette domain-containing protein [bacterium]